MDGRSSRLLIYVMHYYLKTRLHIVLSFARCFLVWRSSYLKIPLTIVFKLWSSETCRPLSWRFYPLVSQNSFVLNKRVRDTSGDWREWLMINVRNLDQSFSTYFWLAAYQKFFKLLAAHLLLVISDFLRTLQKTPTILNVFLNSLGTPAEIFQQTGC